MASDDELLQELERIAVRTASGSFVSLDDVRRLIEGRQQEQLQDAAVPYRLDVHRARGLARQHLESEGFGAQRPVEPGRSVSATDRQPQSSA